MPLCPMSVDQVLNIYKPTVRSFASYSMPSVKFVWSTFCRIQLLSASEPGRVNDCDTQSSLNCQTVIWIYFLICSHHVCLDPQNFGHVANHITIFEIYPKNLLTCDTSQPELENDTISEDGAEETTPSETDEPIGPSICRIMSRGNGQFILFN